MTQRFLISYPRSGQHMMERMIRHVFALHGYEYSYCEYYNCCFSTPCRFNAMLQKNHDWELDFPIDAGLCAVLYRADRIRQIDAWLRYRNSTTKRGKWNHIVDPNPVWWTRERYKRGLLNHLRRGDKNYHDFVAKWVTSRRDNVTAVDYDQVIERPARALRQVLVHLFPGVEFGARQIERAVEVERPRYINRMPDEVYEEIRRRLQAGQ
jgi:hypothetical protein